MKTIFADCQSSIQIEMKKQIADILFFVSCITVAMCVLFGITLTWLFTPHQKLQLINKQ